MRATALVVLSACCFGSIPVLTTLATGAGLGLTSALTWRYTIGALLLVAAMGGPSVVTAPGRRWLAMLLLLGAGQAVIAFVSLSALRFVPVATLTFLFYTYPAWVAAIGAVRGTDPLTPVRAGALALSLAGIAVIVGSPWAGAARADMHPIGALLALASAVLYAAYIPLLDHYQRVTSAGSVAVYATGGAALVLAIAGAVTGGLQLVPPSGAWMPVVVMGVVSTTVAFLAILRGLRELGPVRTAIVSTVEPFWASLLGAAVLAQPLSPRTLAGGALIASAVVLLQLRRR